MAEDAPGARLEWREAVSRLNERTTRSAGEAFARGETAGACDFLARPLRTWIRTLSAGPPGGRAGRALLAAYADLVHAAKLWEMERVWKEAHVAHLRRAGSEIVVLREWRDTIERLFRERTAGEPLAGGRGGTSRIVTEHGPVVVRRFLRGGAMRWAGATYVGHGARPLREFWTLLRARRLGLPVPEPVAALVERRLGVLYRATLVMGEIEEAMPVWTFLERAERPLDLARALGAALAALHGRGLLHRDLNLTNILVLGGPEGPEFAFVDLDGARLVRRPLGGLARRWSLRRIRRSARRLDPVGRLVGEAFLEALERAYWEATRTGNR